MKEYKTLRTKLKINKVTDLCGWKNEFIRYAANDLESILEMLIEVVKQSTVPYAWKYIKMKLMLKGKGNVKEMKN